MTKPYETFDIDLRNGRIREDSFASIIRNQTVELKRDYLCCDTGNIAVEYLSKSVERGQFRSGLSITEAGVHAFEVGYERYLVIMTGDLKALTFRAWQEGRDKWIGDGNNHLNALIPVEWFFEERGRKDD